MAEPVFPPPPAPSTALTGTVGDWCASIRERGLHLYVVIDEVQDGVYRWGKGMAHEERNLFADRTQDPQALSIAPRLRLICPEHLERATRLLEEQSPEQPDAFLIASELELDELAARLMRRFDVSIDGLEMLLRLWDARVFRTLRDALCPDNARLLLALGTQALVSDRCGAHCTVELHEEETDLLHDKSLNLQQEKADALVALAHPDTVLAMIRDISPELLRQLPEANRHATAASQVNECLSRGLKSLRDHALALALTIEYGLHWWSEPRWQEVLLLARETSLLDAYLKTMAERA